MFQKVKKWNKGLGRLIQYSLTERTFRIISSERRIKEGVPQGSAISQILYSNCTSNILKGSRHIKTYIYADDTANTIRNRHNGRIGKKMENEEQHRKDTTHSNRKKTEKR